MLATLLLKPYFKDMSCTVRLLKWYSIATLAGTVAVLDRYFHFCRPRIYPKGHSEPISVCLSVRHTPIFVSKQLNGQSSFWHRGYLRLILHCVGREFRYFQK